MTRKQTNHGWRGAALLLALLAGLALLSGCVGIQRDPNTALPGNSPASWEGRSLGVPVG